MANLKFEYMRNEDSFERRYYSAIVKENYIGFLIHGYDRFHPEEQRYVSSVLINGKAMKRKRQLYEFIGELRKAKGNIWLINFLANDPEAMERLKNGYGVDAMIRSPFKKCLKAMGFFIKSIAWMCSVQQGEKDAAIRFLFFEREPTFFNQGKGCYCYRKGRVELSILLRFKCDLERGISRLRAPENDLFGATWDDLPETL